MRVNGLPLVLGLLIGWATGFFMVPRLDGAESDVKRVRGRYLPTRCGSEVEVDADHVDSSSLGYHADDLRPPLIPVIGFGIEVDHGKGRRPLRLAWGEQAHLSRGQHDAVFIEGDLVAAHVVLALPGELADRHEQLVPGRRHDHDPQFLAGKTRLSVAEQACVFGDLLERGPSRRIVLLDLDQHIVSMPVAGQDVAPAASPAWVGHSVLGFHQLKPGFKQPETSSERRHNLSFAVPAHVSHTNRGHRHFTVPAGCHS